MLRSSTLFWSTCILNYKGSLEQIYLGNLHIGDFSKFNQLLDFFFLPICYCSKWKCNSVESKYAINWYTTTSLPYLLTIKIMRINSFCIIPNSHIIILCSILLKKIGPLNLKNFLGNIHSSISWNKFEKVLNIMSKKYNKKFRSKIHGLILQMSK